MAKTVSISIVTYNNEKEILTLLKSIINNSNLEIFLVDNNSTDKTVALVKKYYPEIKVLVNNKNIGFGAAHNLIISQLNSQYHIFVNPDIIIKDNTLSDICRFFDFHKDVVAISPQILNFDGTEQYLPKRQPLIRYMIGGRLESKGSLFTSWRDEYTMKRENISDYIDIDFCTGCFLAVRTESIVKIKGFDPKYFLYFEDADLTKQLQNFGRTVYNPQIEVFHEWKRESAKSKRLFFISLKSMIRYFGKWGWKF